MQIAFMCNPDCLPVVRMLILRGVPARPEDFTDTVKYYMITTKQYRRDLLPRRRELMASLEADLDLNDRTFLGLFLAGGVHARNTNPTYATTTTVTVTTKRVRTQRSDGGWSDPVTVPCEPRLAVTAAPTIPRSAQVAAAQVEENHLPKLRGFRNTEVRIGIAGFLGVREALDLARLRAAWDVVAALPEPVERELQEEEEEEEEEEEDDEEEVDYSTGWLLYQRWHQLPGSQYFVNSVTACINN